MFRPNYFRKVSTIDRNLYGIFKNLLPETQDQLLQPIIRNALNDVKTLTTRGLLQMKPGKTAEPIKAMAHLAKAANLAQSIETEIHDENRKIIADAYAYHAVAIYKFHPEQVTIAEHFVKAALKLDPSNPAAQDLKLRMDFNDHHHFASEP